MNIQVKIISEQPTLLDVQYKDGKHRHNFNPSYLGYTTLICQVGKCLEPYHNAS